MSVFFQFSVRLLVVSSFCKQSSVRATRDIRRVVSAIYITAAATYSAIRVPRSRQQYENDEFLGETSNSARTIRNGRDCTCFEILRLPNDGRLFYEQHELNVDRAANYSYRAFDLRLDVCGINILLRESCANL